MSIIYGFSFKYSAFSSTKINRYIVLETHHNTYCLQCYDNGTCYSIDISKKVDELCDRLIKMDINSWNMKEFDEPMELFPGFCWTLYIETDRINVSCSGTHNYPPNWSDFTSIMSFIGIRMFV